jgi:hypothetical protein
VHHKIPHRGDERLLYSWNNLQALAKQCHDRIAAAEGSSFGNPVPVWGSKTKNDRYVDRAHPGKSFETHYPLLIFVAALEAL